MAKHKEKPMYSTTVMRTLTSAGTTISSIRELEAFTNDRKENSSVARNIKHQLGRLYLNPHKQVSKGDGHPDHLKPIGVGKAMN